MIPASKPITQLLLEWGRGDSTALARLMPLVYEELHRLANRHLRRERAGHTLSATALVHETYLRLINQRQVCWQDRAHFYAISAQLMRRILVNYARDQRARKRGGTEARLSLDEALALPAARDVDLVALDDALMSLSELDPSQSQVIELRFFGGLTIEETAAVMNVSPATVKSKWSIARAWLHRELHRGNAHDA